GQHAGRDRTGGGSGDHGKGIAVARQQFGQRLQHANLVGGAGTATGEDQPDDWSRAHQVRMTLRICMELVPPCTPESSPLVTITRSPWRTSSSSRRRAKMA